VLRFVFLHHVSIVTQISRRRRSVAVCLRVLLTYVVLAAGAARRMGRDKLSALLAGSSPLERVGRLLVGRPVVLVCGDGHRDAYTSQMPQATVVVNHSPQNGMTSSFRSALPLLRGSDRVGIVLADKPLLSRSTLERLEGRLASSDRDIAYPQSPSGEPGHPVYLSRRAMDVATGLPDGDTMRFLRDDPALSTLAIECDDPGAYVDIDTEADWFEAERLARRLAAGIDAG
jgi:CTP:molybdopterin cytidylyltransferase MocA